MSAFAVIVVLVPVVGLVFLLANALLETPQLDAEKSTTYECGLTPLQGLTRLPLAIAFYLVGLLFLVFDLELLLLIPLSVSWINGGPFPMTIFVGLLFVLAAGIWYEINEGALEFTTGNQPQSLLNRQFLPLICTFTQSKIRPLITSYMSLTVALLIGYARNRYMHVCTARYDARLSRVLLYVRNDLCRELGNEWTTPSKFTWIERFG